jgi:hypothetical protein
MPTFSMNGPQWKRICNDLSYGSPQEKALSRRITETVGDFHEGRIDDIPFSDNEVALIYKSCNRNGIPVTNRDVQIFID